MARAGVSVCTTTPVARLGLSGSEEAPMVARQFVSEVLCREHGEHAEDAAKLLATELTAFAVRYGAPPISVSVDCCVAVLRIELTHHGSKESFPNDPEGKLRLLLIDKVSREHGVTRTQEETTHWCTVPTGVVP